MLKNLKESPLTVFRHCETLARHSVHFLKKFSIFEYCKREYLTLGSLYAIFEPWIWRRLGPVPACFSHFSHQPTSPKPHFTFFQQAMKDRETLMQTNTTLQNKLSEYFRRKRTEEGGPSGAGAGARAGTEQADRSVSDLEQRYLNFMSEFGIFSINALQLNLPQLSGRVKLSFI